MFLDSRRDISASLAGSPVTDEEIASLQRFNPPEEEAYKPMGLLVTHREEVTVASSLSQIENVVKQVSFLSFVVLCFSCFDICS